MNLNSFIINKIKTSSIEGFGEYIKTLPLSNRKSYMDRVFRSFGRKPPMIDYNDNIVNRHIPWLKQLRDTKLPELAPVGSELYSKIQNDIKNNNYVSLETGTSLSNAKSIIKRGPSNNIQYSRNDTGITRDYINKAKEHLFKTQQLSDEQSQLFEAKLESGIYTNPEGTKRTKDYALATSKYEKDKPAILKFDIPASLALAEKDKEQQVSRLAWPYTKNHRISNEDGMNFE